MIVIEGPDGAGKSVLVKKLAKAFDIPIAPRKDRILPDNQGPIDDICGWVDRDILNWGACELAIYDRYPLISEPIYGAAIRGEIPDKMSTGWMRARYNSFRSMSLVIWCVPSYDRVRANVDKSEQMKGVTDEIDVIWAMYAVQANTWPGVGMTYDYASANAQTQDTHLFNLVRRHQISWRNFS
jgi:hypothetical protein